MAVLHVAMISTTYNDSRRATSMQIPGGLTSLTACT